LILSDANLSGADLTGAKVSAVMINCGFNNTIVEINTDFSDAVIDNLKYLHERNFRKFPDVIKNKQELRARLKEKGLPEDTIVYYLSFSQLPEKLKRK
jgi:uncharacterized protein YjbI with pentapeptide repeats